MGAAEDSGGSRVLGHRVWSMAAAPMPSSELSLGGEKYHQTLVMGLQAWQTQVFGKLGKESFPKQHGETL